MTPTLREFAKTLTDLADEHGDMPTLVAHADSEAFVIAGVVIMRRADGHAVALVVDHRAKPTFDKGMAEADITAEHQASGELPPPLQPMLRVVEAGDA